ncbi:DUF305 domain-containing protein [Streptosporangium sp. CA-135522]|uniref:DUF305 domain-containing protein n=1 Tax=Streptosporangium sp. CA-135522 TaxID=3240072 RepID=UPI003D92CF74
MTKRAALIVLGVLLLTGCGAHSIQELHDDGHAAHGDGHAAHGAARTPGTATGTGRDFNPTDVMFLQMMMAHNGQGVELARLAPNRPARTEVKTLAAAIATTQEVESASMSDRLIGWGQPPTAKPDEHAAHGGMPGASKAEIAAIADAAPADFEKKFLNMMIAQQDDAVQMARMELADGLSREVKALAARIEASRSAQIKQFLALLGQ